MPQPFLEVMVNSLESCFGRFNAGWLPESLGSGLISSAYKDVIAFGILLLVSHKTKRTFRSETRSDFKCADYRVRTNRSYV